MKDGIRKIILALTALLLLSLIAGCSNSQPTHQGVEDAIAGGPAPAGVQAEINAQQAQKAPAAAATPSKPPSATTQ